MILQRDLINPEASASPLRKVGERPSPDLMGISGGLMCPHGPENQAWYATDTTWVLLCHLPHLVSLGAWSTLWLPTPRPDFHFGLRLGNLSLVRIV